MDLCISSPSRSRFFPFLLASQTRAGFLLSKIHSFNLSLWFSCLLLWNPFWARVKKLQYLYRLLKLDIQLSDPSGGKGGGVKVVPIVKKGTGFC